MHTKKYSPIFVTDPHRALVSLCTAQGQGINASKDILFGNRIFGRDSLRVYMDILSLPSAELYRDMVQNGLKLIGSLQGTAENGDEMPGKIHHEYLENNILRYSAIDPTPMYVITVGMFCKKYGNDILHAVVRRKDGIEISVREIVIDALDFMHKNMSDFDNLYGYYLLYFKPSGSDGPSIQVWTDSHTAFIHEDGKKANTKGPIASIDVQALAYDAFLSGAILFPEYAEKYMSSALLLQESVFQAFWIREESRFASGIDTLPNGNLHLIKTATTHPGWLLDSGIFDNLDEESRETYVHSIISALYDANTFLTDAGFRCRTIAFVKVLHHTLAGFDDYHGECAVWPMNNGVIANGFIRHGYKALAEQLMIRDINSFNIAKEFYEFFYVDINGYVYYDPHTNEVTDSTDLYEFAGTNIAERGQAWSVSRAVRIVETAHDLLESTPVNDFERYLLESNPQKHILTAEERISFPRPLYRHSINVKAGIEKETIYYRAGS